MSKISKHDSHQQFNKNNNVKWGDALDNADEKVRPTSAVKVSGAMQTEDRKYVMSETFFNEQVEVVDIPENEVPEDAWADDVTVVSDDEFAKLEAEEKAPEQPKKKPQGFQKKIK